MFSKTITFVVSIFLISFAANTYSADGYELFYNGKRKAHVPNMTLYQSIGNLHENIKTYPNID